MKRVVVHIDRLVLKGFRQEDRLAIAEGLRQELARTLGSAEAIRQLTSQGRIPKLRVAKLRVETSPKARHVGEEAARGIGREIAK